MAVNSASHQADRKYCKSGDFYENDVCAFLNVLVRIGFHNQQANLVIGY
jgi:hypothetical protein